MSSPADLDALRPNRATAAPRGKLQRPPVHSLFHTALFAQPLPHSLFTQTLPQRQARVVPSACIQVVNSTAASHSQLTSPLLSFTGGQLQRPPRLRVARAPLASSRGHRGRHQAHRRDPEMARFLPLPYKALYCEPSTAPLCASHTPCRADACRHEENGMPVFDPHTHILEDGGMKVGGRHISRPTPRVPHLTSYSRPCTQGTTGFPPRLPLALSSSSSPPHPPGPALLPPLSDDGLGAARLQAACRPSWSPQPRQDDLARPRTTSHDLTRPPTTSHDLPRPPTTSHDLPRPPKISHDLARAPKLTPPLTSPPTQARCARGRKARPLSRHPTPGGPSPPPTASPTRPPLEAEPNQTKPNQAKPSEREPVPPLPPPPPPPPPAPPRQSWPPPLAARRRVVAPPPVFGRSGPPKTSPPPISPPPSPSCQSVRAPCRASACIAPSQPSSPLPSHSQPTPTPPPLIHRRLAPPVSFTGAIEAHGPHLPLGVDAMHNAALLGRALSRLPESALVLALPPMDVGVSCEHSGFAGMLSHDLSRSLTIFHDLP